MGVGRAVEGKILIHGCSIHSCIGCLQDLGILGRPLSKLLIVDNSPHAFAYQPANAVPIISWYEDKSDTELLKLREFLQWITQLNVGDIRPVLRSLFSLPEKEF